MKKTLIIFVIISLILTSCDSAKKALQRGSYDVACAMAVKKLQKKPYDEEHAQIFTVAYRKANQKDIDRIDYLRQSKEQRAWDEILRLYKKLEKRQTLAETILPLRAGGKTVNFEHINYNQQIIEAKNSAAYFHYNEGVKLMNGNREDARKAYYQFIKVRNYTNNYNDLEQRIRAAEKKGTVKVLLLSINRATATVPVIFMQNLTNIGTQYIDDKWRKYYNNPANSQFDYRAIVVITSINVSPDKIDEKKEIVKKKIKDGWEYEFDARGNVKKDSLGNDIKRPKYKMISCTITKKTQIKTAVVSAIVDVQNNVTSKIVSSVPIKSAAKFNYTSSFANGNLAALSKQTRETVGKSPIAFPTDNEMIEKTTLDLQNKIIDALKRSKNLIK